MPHDAHRAHSGRRMVFIVHSSGELPLHDKMHCFAILLTAVTLAGVVMACEPSDDRAPGGARR
jgi:hypothetical protein